MPAVLTAAASFVSQYGGDVLRPHPSQKHHVGARLRAMAREQNPASSCIRGPVRSGVVSVWIPFYRCEDRILEGQSPGPVTHKQWSGARVPRYHHLLGLELRLSEALATTIEGGDVCASLLGGCTRGHLSEPRSQPAPRRSLQRPHGSPPAFLKHFEVKFT